MRLIDADALVNHLEEVIKKQNGKSVDLVPIGELLTFIAREPTINDWIPYQREVAEEFENSTPLDGDVEKWKLSVAIKCNHNGSRKRSMTELLFCMVRSGR